MAVNVISYYKFSVELITLMLWYDSLRFYSSISEFVIKIACACRTAPRAAVACDDPRRLLTASDHVDGLMSTCSSLVYLLRIRRNHGIPETPLKDIFRAIVLSRLLYCAPVESLLRSLVSVVRK